MSECRIGQICDSSALITGAVATRREVIVGNEAWNRASELLKSGQYSECLRIRDDESNIRRLLPALGTMTIAGGLSSLWMGLATSEARAEAPTPTKSKPDGSKVGAAVAGVFALAVGAWGAVEHMRLLGIPAARAKLGCDEVIKAVELRTLSVVSEQPHEFQATGYCSGAAVLMGDCVPQRRLAAGYEWSTKPLTPQQIAVGAGVVIVGAAAVYTGVAGVAAVAELAASWGWVPILAL